MFVYRALWFLRWLAGWGWLAVRWYRQTRCGGLGRQCRGQRLMTAPPACSFDLKASLFAWWLLLPPPQVPFWQYHHPALSMTPPCFGWTPSGKVGKSLWPPSFSFETTFIYSPPAWEMNIRFSALPPSAVIISWCSGFDKMRRIVTWVTQTCQLSKSLVVKLKERPQKTLVSTYDPSECVVFFSSNGFCF